jgi:hypothetical protein
VPPLPLPPPPPLPPPLTLPLPPLSLPAPLPELLLSRRPMISAWVTAFGGSTGMVTRSSFFALSSFALPLAPSQG